MSKIVDAFVEYHYGDNLGRLMVRNWDADMELVKRKPKTDDERLEALEMIVLEIHAKLKRLSE